MSTLKIRDMQTLLAAGVPVAVQFGAQIEDCEAYPEPGMRAMALRYETSEDACCKIRFDFSAFDAHNQTLESANYYDKAGQPTLTAREAGHYKPLDYIYFEAGEEMGPWFEVLPTESLTLFTEYLAVKKDRPQLGYTSWLESEVLALRKAYEA